MQSTLGVPKKRRTFLKSARACLQNAQGLIDNARALCNAGPPYDTSFYILVTAQEELAKAFLLCLIAEGAVPWNQFIWKSVRDHSCKQLLGLIIDYLAPDLDEFLSRFHNGTWPRLPRTIADAINIYRHEKIGRQESSTWEWAEPLVYDERAKSVSKGLIEKKKHRAIYTEIARNGALIKSEPVTIECVSLETDRSERFANYILGLCSNDKPDPDYKRVVAAFALVFEKLAETGID